MYNPWAPSSGARRLKKKKHRSVGAVLLSTILSTSMLSARGDAQLSSSPPPPPTTSSTPPPPSNNLLEKDLQGPMAAPPVEPGPPQTRTTAPPPKPTVAPPKPPPNTTAAPTNTVPPVPTAPPPEPVIPSSSLTTTATTVKTFSDNIITINPASTQSASQNTQSTESVRPTETPYGRWGSDTKSGGVMLIVSLVVVFVVLSIMGIVVFCLFRRRNAKHRMGIFGKPNSSSNSSSASGLNDLVAAAATSGNKGHSGSDHGMSAGPRSSTQTPRSMTESDMDLNKAFLQEMSEQHQNALMTRKSSTLSLGSMRAQHQQYHNRASMLSPTLQATRPHSMGSGYWAGSQVGTPILGPSGGNNYSAHSSIVIGSGDYISGPMPSSGEFRTSQYDESHGLGYGLPAPHIYANGSNGSGSLRYSSNEMLLMKHPQAPFTHSNGSSSSMSRRTSLSPGLYPSYVAGQEKNQHSPVVRSKTISVANGAGGYSHHQQQQVNGQQQSDPMSQRNISAPIQPIASGSEERSESNPPSNGDGANAVTTFLSTGTTVMGAGGEEQRRSLTPGFHGGSSLGQTGSVAGLPSSLGSDKAIEHPQQQQWRPHSMSAVYSSEHNNNSLPPMTLEIPPAITTRRRSQMPTNSMYSNQGEVPQMYYTNASSHVYHPPPPPSTPQSRPLSSNLPSHPSLPEES
ncbi:hypothetical protein BGZ94_006964 [Podila epigama]|nr:hypothetical protein BGZ94_006964 [Podila epigama]